MTRADWQQIAEERLLAAQALLGARSWPSAYYLAGYGVIASPEVIFLEKRFSEKCWTHEIDDLVRLAGLEATRAADTSANTALLANWLTAANWNERSRYQMKTQAEAEGLYNAIADNIDGVMQWIRIRW